MKLDRSALEAHPLPPVVNGDKTSKGTILIIAGSREVPGAALLAANGAMRAGAGKLQIATVESAAMALAVAMPEAMVVGLPEKHGGFAGDAIRPIRDLAASADCVVAGPGVKRNADCRAIGKALVDGDGALVLDVAFIETLEPQREARKTPAVLLPDRSELATMLGCGADAVEADPVGCGRRAAERFRAIVLVKGVTSHVVTPTGETWSRDSETAGLGVSGSGDVLAGIVGGLLSRGAEPLNALLWAVWLHGEAGAKLAREVGPIGFLAREIPGRLPGLLPR